MEAFGFGHVLDGWVNAIVVRSQGTSVVRNVQLRTAAAPAVMTRLTERQQF